MGENLLNKIAKKKALILGFDDVLYPEKDYVLQVFYMFGQFIEFIEAKPVSKAITEDLKSLYLSTQAFPKFEAIAEKYDLKPTYKDKLERLYHQVQLPLRLDTYPIINELLQALIEKEISIFVLTQGDPFMQLNKLKQMNLLGLEKHLKLYFLDELNFKKLDPISFILEENDLKIEDVFLLDKVENINLYKGLNPIEYLDSNTLNLAL